MPYPPTAGPWYFTAGDIWTTPDGPDDGGIQIGGPDRDEDETSPTERDANGRLMAAAPELLETVRMLAGYIADTAALGDEMSVREFLRRNVDGVLAKARPDLVE